MKLSFWPCALFILVFFFSGKVSASRLIIKAKRLPSCKDAIPAAWVT